MQRVSEEKKIKSNLNISSISCARRQSVVQLAPREAHQKEALPLHKAPNPGTGEGVSVQHVPSSGPQIRSGQTAQFDRETSENLVPEPQDEDEERQQRPAERQLSAIIILIRAVRGVGGGPTGVCPYYSQLLHTLLSKVCVVN